MAEAKANLSQVLTAARQTPQVVTKHGKPEAVIVSAEDWETRSRTTVTFLEMMDASPLVGSGWTLPEIDDLAEPAAL